MTTHRYYWVLYVCVIWTAAAWLTLSYGEDPAYSLGFVASALGCFCALFLVSAVIWCAVRLFSKDFAKIHMPQIFIVCALLSAFLMFREERYKQAHKVDNGSSGSPRSQKPNHDLYKEKTPSNLPASATSSSRKHENFMWKPNGCSVSIEFPGKPTEKVVSSSDGPLQVATLISDFALMKASFQDAELPEFNIEDRKLALKICADDAIEQFGLQQSQYEQSQEKLGQRVRVKGVKAVRHSDRVDSERVIIDLYIIDNGFLTLTVTHGVKELDYTAILFLKNVADKTSNWQYQ